MATTMAAIRDCGTVKLAMVTSLEPQGSPVLSTCDPIRRVSSVSNRMSTPMVRMAREFTSPRSRRINTTSMSRAATPVAAMPNSTATQNPNCWWVTPMT